MASGYLYSDTSSSGGSKYRITVKKAKRVVDQIVKALQNPDFKEEVGIETTEVFKGGSMGQGTRVTGYYDIDLVLYSRDIDAKDAKDNDGYKELLEKTNSYLKRNLGHRYKWIEFTKVAVKFSCTLSSGDPLDVDLLLSPFWENQHEFWRFLQTVHPAPKRSIFSTSASKYQTDLIKHSDQRVKELIARAKAWRNVQWEGESEGRPRSFLLSMLIIVAYERLLHKPNKFKKLSKRVGDEFQTLVRNICDSQDLSLTIPGAKSYAGFEDLLPHTPYILDPGNPSNNLLKSGVTPVEGDRARWSVFAARVHTFSITDTPLVIMGLQ